MASVREWQFKRKFRTNAYGWRASSLAIGRLKEAAAEIKSVAKSDPVAAGDGVVSLMERIWPAFQGIDTSSGALGAAVFRTVNELARASCFWLESRRGFPNQLGSDST